MTTFHSGSKPGEFDDVLRRSAMPLAVIDTGTQQIRAANAPFAALIGVEQSELADLSLADLSIPEERPFVEGVMAAVAHGFVDSAQGRGRLCLPSGDTLDVLAWVRPLGSGPQRASALVGLIAADAGLSAEPPAIATPESPRVTLATLDHDWRFSEVCSDAPGLLGWEPQRCRGTPLLGMVHPNDAPLLLLTLGRSAIDHQGATTLLRVRGHDGGWLDVRLCVSPLCEHNPPRFAVAIWSPLRTSSTESSDERASRLEGHLWRIAVELQAANLGRVQPIDPTWWAHPALRGLSERQMEVLRRLLAGESVRATARELFLSESTVRNHLSAIYRRLGVHSRDELLAQLKSDTGDPE
jgi:DNA-binding CsgD family transcriptional regulator/PAS domain-containing protein